MKSCIEGGKKEREREVRTSPKYIRGCTISRSHHLSYVVVLHHMLYNFDVYSSCVQEYIDCTSMSYLLLFFFERRYSFSVVFVYSANASNDPATPQHPTPYLFVYVVYPYYVFSSFLDEGSPTAERLCIRSFTHTFTFTFNSVSSSKNPTKSTFSRFIPRFPKKIHQFKSIH